MEAVLPMYQTICGKNGYGRRGLILRGGFLGDL